MGLRRLLSRFQRQPFQDARELMRSAVAADRREAEKRWAGRKAKGPRG